MDIAETVSQLADRSLLLLDDDMALRTRLGRALEQRGRGGRRHRRPRMAGSTERASRSGLPATP